MNYRLGHEGRELGVFSRDELYRRRMSGELSGTEWVLGEGMREWQPIDAMLQATMPLKSATQPPQKSSRQIALLWVTGIATFVISIAILAFCVPRMTRKQNFPPLVQWPIPGQTTVQSDTNEPVENTPPSESVRADAMEAATRPVEWTSNTLTEADVRRGDKEFVTRQWLDGYKQRGHRDPAYDADALLMLQSWIEEHHGDGSVSNLPPSSDLGDKLAAQTNCDDPLLLTVAGLNSVELFELRSRLQRAIKGFENSPHRAYPKFYAAIELMKKRGSNSQSEKNKLLLDTLQWFAQCFSDGSFKPTDQERISELLINGEARSLFDGHRKEIIQIVQNAGRDFKWLALVLDGESNIIEAWNARGGGYADSVTQQGWQGFESHLRIARMDFTDAWDLHPDWAMAPVRMMTVSLGDSGITEMRKWFDRSVTDQIDYAGAWSEMRWGLRPRWFGDEASMLAFGELALKTGRFDTDVPRKLYDSIWDLEQEEGNVGPGQYIFGRADIWPDLKKMYEGYIAEPSQADSRKGWRTAYACVAYFGGKYDVARSQFEAMDWNPEYGKFTGWNVECSLMPWEVAGRTGPAGDEITRAESSRAAGKITDALALYRELDHSSKPDSRTKEFIHYRIASLDAEERLNKGEWIDFQPKDDHDPNWVFWRGTTRFLPDGALEVESGDNGHFLYSRVRVGADFEVRGQFEVASSSTRSFQAGIVMGLPDLSAYSWNSFRMKRNKNQGDVVSLGHGWTINEVARAATLHDVTNAFDFSFQGGVGSAWVNGREVLTEVKPRQGIDVPDDSYMLGLGAFNDVNKTVIRYRNVQVRRLDTQSRKNGDK